MENQLNPLLIDLILENILGVLQLPDLLKCRTVCRQWNEEALHVLHFRRRHLRVYISPNSDYSRLVCAIESNPDLFSSLQLYMFNLSLHEKEWEDFFTRFGGLIQNLHVASKDHEYDLCPLLRKCDHLEKLTIGWQFRWGALQDFPSLPGLRDLHFQHCIAPEKHAEALRLILPNSPNLHSLRFSFNHLKGCDQIYKVLSQNVTRGITNLQIFAMPTENEDLTRLGQCDWSSLTVFRAGGLNTLSGKTVDTVIFANVLQNMRNLVHLDMGNVRFDCEKSFPIPVLPRLLTLRIRASAVTSEDFWFKLPMLQICKLKSFEDHFTDSGMSQGLVHFRQPKNHPFRHSRLRVLKMKLFKNSMFHFSFMQVLSNLTFVAVTSSNADGLGVFLDAFSECPRLNRVDIKLKNLYFEKFIEDVCANLLGISNTFAFRDELKNSQTQNVKENLQKLKTSKGISDFRSLHRLTLENCCAECICLPSALILEGFLAMPQLRHLNLIEFSVNQFLESKFQETNVSLTQMKRKLRPTRPKREHDSLTVG